MKLLTTKWKWFTVVLLVVQLHFVNGERFQDRENASTIYPIRLNVSLIPLIVNVIDKDGNPVLHLRKGDFRVLDNDMQEDIQFFLEESLFANPELAREQFQLKQIPSSGISHSGRRTFLILLGRGGLTDSFNTTDDLIQFIHDNLLPQDLIAVMAYNRASEFTSNHEEAISILRRYKDLREKIEIGFWKQKQGNSLSIVYGAGVPDHIQRYIDQIFNVPSQSESASVENRSAKPDGLRKAKPNSTGKISDRSLEDIKTATDIENSSQDIVQSRESTLSHLPSVDPFDLIRLRALTSLSFSEFIYRSRMTDQDLQSLFTAINYLRYMEEPKYLIFFSDQGLYLPKSEAENDIIAMANDARVSIHTFQTGGTESQFSDALSIMTPAERSRWGPVPIVQNDRDGMLALSSLSQIANNTGGKATTHQFIKPALQKLDALTRSYYVLGYDPGLIQWDGAFRRIKIEVDRPGVNVFHRQGYYASRNFKPFNSREFLAYSRISSTARYSKEVKDIIFDCHLVEEKSGEKRKNVSINLNIHSISLAESENYKSGRIFVAIFYKRPDGKSEMNTWNHLDISLNPDEYEQALLDGIKISVSIPPNISKSSIKAIIYDAGSDKVGCKFFK